MQPFHMLQLNLGGCTDLFYHGRLKMQVVKVFVPQNMHHHISPFMGLYIKYEPI